MGVVLGACPQRRKKNQSPDFSQEGSGGSPLGGSVCGESYAELMGLDRKPGEQDREAAASGRGSNDSSFSALTSDTAARGVSGGADEGEGQGGALVDGCLGWDDLMGAMSEHSPAVADSGNCLSASDSMTFDSLVADHDAPSEALAVSMEEVHALFADTYPMEADPPYPYPYPDLHDAAAPAAAVREGPSVAACEQKESDAAKAGVDVGASGGRGPRKAAALGARAAGGVVAEVPANRPSCSVSEQDREVASPSSSRKTTLEEPGHIGASKRMPLIKPKVQSGWFGRFFFWVLCSHMPESDDLLAMALCPFVYAYCIVWAQEELFFRSWVQFRRVWIQEYSRCSMLVVLAATRLR